MEINKQDLLKIDKYFRAANYISAIQIYLKSNFLLERELTFDDIKPRLLGHWGTCPGINFVYAHLQYFIRQHKINVIFINGPGHGAPAIQSNLYIEGSLGAFYPQATHNYEGLAYVAKNFSWPYGFPSHSWPGTPGAILEGGELGYSLSTAYGAVFDNPDLLAVCLIGDGEAETGALATSWHLNKFLDPKHNGAVLPILHLNEYKISGPTIFGRMSFWELKSLFQGYGYFPLFVELVEGENIHAKMQEVLSVAYERIKNIQYRFRVESENTKNITPNWPLIILKTPKGWTGIKFLKNKKIEGNYLSHQVIVKNANVDYEELNLLYEWLKSYKFNEIFDSKNGFVKDILDIVPANEYKMGLSKYVHFKQKKSIIVPDASIFAEYEGKPGLSSSSSMRRLGDFLNALIDLNKNSRCIRIFSPDETYSNKLDKIFCSTKRCFIWPHSDYDEDLGTDGFVVEMLSEQALFGLLQGYTLTGRLGFFISYEAFVQVISSMMDQYLKFIKVSREIKWRPEYHSINIILTSSGWRQDHNGFTHQNPGFLSNMIEKNDPYVRVFFPLDGNTTLAAIEYALNYLHNGINIFVAGKTKEPNWLSIYEARSLVKKGLDVINFLSDNNPDIVICGIGDYVSKEAIAAIKLLKKDFPSIKIRFVVVVNLIALKNMLFDEIFTSDKNVIFNFHGYPDTLKKILFDFGNTKRFTVFGYIENGSTTTPYDMQIRNGTSRWHLYLKAIEILHAEGKIKKKDYLKKLNEYENKFKLHKKYIKSFGLDLPEIVNFNFEF